MGYVFCMLKIRDSKERGQLPSRWFLFPPKALPHVASQLPNHSSLYGALGMLLPSHRPDFASSRPLYT